MGGRGTTSKDRYKSTGARSADAPTASEAVDSVSAEMFSGKRDYEISYQSDTDPNMMEEHLQNNFDGEFTVHDLADLAGAADGSKVKIGYDEYSGVFSLEIDHPYFEAIRDISSGTLYNSSFEAKGGAPSGMGARMLLQETKFAKRFGIDTITTYAAGEHEGLYNGYYTWPRLGFNMRVREPLQKQAMQEGLGSVKNTHELFAKPGGAAWWKLNGDQGKASFDARPGSTSMKMLKSYASALKINTGD